MIVLENQFRFNKDNIVTLTVKELDDLVYNAAFRASKRTEQQLFGGLLSFINRLYDENEMIIETLEYLKSVHAPKKRKSSKKKEEVSEVETKEITANNVPVNNKIGKLISNMSDEDKQKMAQAIKDAIEQNRLINIPTGVNINIPDQFK